MGTNYTRPLVPEPEEYREEFPESESIANTPWWELFGDTVLTALIDTALVHNRDLGASVARISEARAALGIVHSQLFPRVGYAADGSYGGTLGNDGQADGSGGAFLNASWQIDLWGKIRRAKEAALQELLATEEAYRGVTIALVADVASSYLLLRDLDNRLTISERTLEVWQQRLDVVQTRFDAGMVNEVDLNQAQIQVYQAEVQVQTFERLRKQTENAISLLLGQLPQPIERGLLLSKQVLPPDIPTGLPSELLQRRPDILQAERQLHAQTARIGSAIALKFPQFNLTADLGAQFDNTTTGIFGLGAQFFGPIYNQGELQRRVEVEVARRPDELSRGPRSATLAVFISAQGLRDHAASAHVHRKVVSSARRGLGRRAGRGGHNRGSATGRMIALFSSRGEKSDDKETRC
jgi:multidrug efflux system outer membrane protein